MMDVEGRPNDIEKKEPQDRNRARPGEALEREKALPEDGIKRRREGIGPAAGKRLKLAREQPIGGRLPGLGRKDPVRPLGQGPNAAADGQPGDRKRRKT